MKFLFVSVRYYPESYAITSLCEELVNQGHEVSVVTDKPHVGFGMILKQYQNIDEETINGVKVYRVKEHVRKKGIISLALNYLSIWTRYKKKIMKIDGDFDVVISHVMSPIFSMASANKYARKHHIPHIHYGVDLWPESMVFANMASHKSLLYKIMKHYSKDQYKKCQLIAFASPSTKTYFNDVLGLNIPFKHIYQPTITKSPSLDSIKHDYLMDDKYHILYCGATARMHRIDLLLHALASFSQRDKIVFDIVGSGSELSKLKQIVKDKHLTDIVNFHGHVLSDKTPLYYQNADILFLPLYYNCASSLMIPQKEIEYLMYGRPIFAMIQGDGKDILNNASVNNINSEQNIYGLITGLEKLVSLSKDTLEQIGNDNRNYYDNNQRLKVETIAKEIVDASEEVIKKYNAK